jgi:hypothetical protein
MSDASASLKQFAVAQGWGRMRPGGRPSNLVYLKLETQEWVHEPSDATRWTSEEAAAVARALRGAGWEGIVIILLFG